MTRVVAPIESVVEIAVAAWFGACIGLGMWLIAPLPAGIATLLALGSAALSGLAALVVVRSWGSQPCALPSFDVQPVADASDELVLTEIVGQGPVGPAGELVLTLAQRLDAQGATKAEAGNELLLEDVLTPINTGSRVIRLFDPAAMPTAGELQSRIDRHLQDRNPAFPDAAQALNDALADLRRSLR